VSHFLLIVISGIITFASRASFLLRPMASAKLKKNRFLEVFPIALFVSLAVNGLAAPGGDLDFSPALAAGVGGVVGAALFKRSILGVAVVGIAGYWIARMAWGV
jgi:branched-subunit amino acid transport protein